MLYIKCRFELSVHHMIILHMHESCIIVGFGITVSHTAFVDLQLVFPDLFKRSFQILDISLQLFFSVPSPTDEFKALLPRKGFESFQ